MKPPVSGDGEMMQSRESTNPPLSVSQHPQLQLLIRSIPSGDPGPYHIGVGDGLRERERERERTEYGVCSS